MPSAKPYYDLYRTAMNDLYPDDPITTTWEELSTEEAAVWDRVVRSVADDARAPVRIERTEDTCAWCNSLTYTACVIHDGCGGCHDCLAARFKRNFLHVWMVLCPECGNKRCPTAGNHRFACTKSNATNQRATFRPGMHCNGCGGTGMIGSAPCDACAMTREGSP